MIDKAAAISSLRPNAQFVLHGDDLSGIEWHTEGVEPVTAEEVALELERLEAAAQTKAESDALARQEAIAHAKSLGFTDHMIAVMYPNLKTPAV